MRMMFTLLAAHLVPAHVFLAPVTRLVPRPAVTTSAFARFPAPRACMGEEDAYRTLGVTQDAGYDEISSRYDELLDKYGDDAARMESIDAAKSKVLDVILRKRMEGSLGATYEGKTAREDIKAPPPTPIWEIANGYRKKMFMRPSPKHAMQVFGLLGGLSLAGWVAPSTAQTTLLINTVSAMGFMYNRGEADVVRDDFGQIGEIRPMKPRPMALTAGITGTFWLWGFLKAKSLIAAMVSPPRGLEVVLRTTLISCSLILPCLFVKVQWIDDY